MPAWTCALCATPNLATAPRCASCGADPDDAALAGLAAAAPEEARALGGGRVFGLDAEALRSGTAFRRLGGLGGVVLALSFVIPAGRARGEYRFAWELFETGPRLALLLPLPLGVLGVLLGLVPGLPAVVRAAGLAAGGLALLLLSLPGHGELALAAHVVEPVLLAGTLLAGAALLARVLDADGRASRVALVLGALLVAVGMLVPSHDLVPRLPGEIVWYARSNLGLDIPLADASLARALWGALERTAGPIFMLALGGLLAPVLLAIAAAIGWPARRGPWDRRGRTLVPFAWLLAPGVGTWLVLVAWNAMGWDGAQAEGLLLARARLAAIAWIAVAWVTAPLARAILPVATSDTPSDPARSA